MSKLSELNVEEAAPDVFRLGTGSYLAQLIRHKAMTVAPVVDVSTYEDGEPWWSLGDPR